MIPNNKPTREAPTQRPTYCGTHTYTPPAFCEGDDDDAQTRIFGENGDQFPHSVFHPLNLASHRAGDVEDYRYVGRRGRCPLSCFCRLCCSCSCRSGPLDERGHSIATTTYPSLINASSKYCSSCDCVPGKPLAGISCVSCKLLIPGRVCLLYTSPSPRD